jgi:hypothetical protein
MVIKVRTPEGKWVECKRPNELSPPAGYKRYHLAEWWWRKPEKFLLPRTLPSRKFLVAKPIRETEKAILLGYLAIKPSSEIPTVKRVFPKAEFIPSEEPQCWTWLKLPSYEIWVPKKVIEKVE